MGHTSLVLTPGTSTMAGPGLTSNNIRYEISDAGQWTFDTDGVNGRSWPGLKVYRVRDLTDTYGKRQVTQQYVTQALNTPVPRGGATIGPEQNGNPVQIIANDIVKWEDLFHEQMQDAQRFIQVGNHVNIKWHYTIPSNGGKHMTFNFYF